MKAYGKIPFPLLFLPLVSYISFQNFFCNYKQCIFLFYPSFSLPHSFHNYTIFHDLDVSRFI